jgi:hypothetical protein
MEFGYKKLRQKQDNNLIMPNPKYIQQSPVAVFVGQFLKQKKQHNVRRQYYNI